MFGLRFFFALIAISMFSSAVRAETVPLPAELNVTADCKLLWEVEAKGVQIYKSVTGIDGKFEWHFEGPLATLTKEGKTVGWHFEGPTWASADRSMLKRRDEKIPVVSAPAPNAKADIPWLRIAVAPEDISMGMGKDVQFVLRINTKGGVPPTDPPVRAGIKVGVDYTATYQFYSGAKER